MLSPHPADPTLTTDNLMEVVKEVEHHWEDLGFNLGFPKVNGQLVDVDWKEIHGMAAVVHEYVRHYPTPSWKWVATTLQGMELDKLADEVTTKYVRGMDVNHVACLIQKLKLSVYVADEGIGTHMVCMGPVDLLVMGFACVSICSLVSAQALWFKFTCVVFVH